MAVFVDNTPAELNSWGRGFNSRQVQGFFLLFLSLSGASLIRSLKEGSTQLIFFHKKWKLSCCKTSIILAKKKFTAKELTKISVFWPFCPFELFTFSVVRPFRFFDLFGFSTFRPFSNRKYRCVDIGARQLFSVSSSFWSAGQKMPPSKKKRKASSLSAANLVWRSFYSNLESIHTYKLDTINTLNKTLTIKIDTPVISLVLQNTIHRKSCTISVMKILFL